MFYVLPNITSALKPLEPEAVESQLRERKKDARQKSGDHPVSNQLEQNHSPITEDTMTVLSVKALILFIEDFIEAHIGAQNDDVTRPVAKHFQPWMRVEHSNANHPIPSVKAANAYSHVAQAVKKNQTSDHQKQSSNTPKLASVYALLHDLRDVQSDKVQFLKIQNDRPFIESIMSAVQKQKTQHQP